MNAQAGQLIRCDTCKQMFAKEPAVFHETSGDVQTVGLGCPHCGARYVAYRTNAAIRSLQAKVTAERQLANKKIRAGTPPNKAERRLRQAKRSLETAMRAFNGR